jgi:peptidoglycan hydrolase CwlO-like protein
MQHPLTYSVIFKELVWRIRLDLNKLKILFKAKISDILKDRSYLKLLTYISKIMQTFISTLSQTLVAVDSFIDSLISKYKSAKTEAEQSKVDLTSIQEQLNSLKSKIEENQNI